MSKSIYTSYHLQFAGFTLLLVVAMLAFQFGLSEFYVPQAWFVLLACAVLYWLTGAFTLRFLGTEHFGNAVMGVKVVRMLLAAAGFFVYVLLDGESVRLLAAVLLIVYLSYSGFEIRALLPNLRRNSETGSQKE